MQNQNTLFVCRKPVMSGVSHSAAFDRANSSAKLLRVRICTCHWPWSQLKTHRFLCKNHRLEKANDGTGFKKPDKTYHKHEHYTTWYLFSKISNEHFKVPLLHTSRSPRVGSGPWQLKISWLSVKSGLKTMERNSVVTGYAGYIWPSWPAIPQPRMDEVDQPRRPDGNWRFSCTITSRTSCHGLRIIDDL